ncbi:putative F420-0 ABC transporter permease subunit [Humidisolicoccus flavus]|uniref:putative F420-0 ABC transporter permease subunit n=1 Tax=Humidisolicoccus flavus TaxID=3111414 RepID=UPI003255BC50
MRRRILLLSVSAAIALPVLAVFAVGFGGAPIAFADVWGTILAHFGLGTPPLEPINDALVWERRVPRVITAIAVGAGLALCGAVMQSVTRNPLADPYLLGLSSGAALGAVSVVLLGIALALPVAAFAGALLALFLTLGLARSVGRITPATTVLAGIAVSALASALTSLVLFWTVTGDSYREIIGWLLGTLAGARWEAVALSWAAVAVVGIPLMLSAKTLDAFAFGETHAASLGIHVPRSRALLLTATALLTGVLVSIAGSIGFVGLVVPHAVRLLVGPGHRALLPLSAALGGGVLLLADTLARTAFEPRELPVGVITALIGAPIFAFLLIQSRRAQS